MLKRYNINMNNLFRKPWFWIGLILLFIFALIFDFVFAGFVVFHNISSGKWSIMLLELGALYSGMSLYGSYLHKPESKQINLMGRVVLVIIAVLAFKGYGFWQGLNFIITVAIFSNLLKWIAHRIYKRKKKIEWI
jgi:hypothetical protein